MPRPRRPLPPPEAPTRPLKRPKISPDIEPEEVARILADYRRADPAEGGRLRHEHFIARLREDDDR